MASDRLRIGFVLEQALGHVTHAQNLRHQVDRDDSIDPVWMWVPYRAPDPWERIPKLPFSVKLSLRARRLVRHALAQHKLDCLYFHTQALTLLGLDFFRAVPAVISLDATPEDFKSIASAYGAQPATGLVDRVKAAWFRAAFSRAAGIVAISDWVKTGLLQHYGVPSEKVKVFRYAVDISQWQASTRAQAQRRRLRLLFVGGDFARKGGHVLLEAFRAGLSEYCELDIVTRDHSVIAEKSVRVHTDLSPNTPDLRRLYAEADLFVLPTLGDANGIAIVEAMAAGLPVITTNVGSLGELVQDGVTGYLVPCNDPMAVLAGVMLFLDRRERLPQMGMAARLSVEKKFNAETSYKGLLAYLKEVSRAWGERAADRQLHA